jgi:hypothetical protein
MNDNADNDDNDMYMIKLFDFNTYWLAKGGKVKDIVVIEQRDSLSCGATGSMWLCALIHTLIHSHSYTRTHTYTHTLALIHTLIHSHSYIHSYTRTHTLTLIHSHIHSHSYTHS